MFASNRGGSAFDLWTITSTGDELTQLTFDSDDQGDASWSPDGQRLVFDAFQNTIGDLFLFYLP